MKKIVSGILLFIVTVTSVLLFSGNPSFAQEQPEEKQEKESPLSFSLGADVVSRYVWRGVEFGAYPQVQPYGSFDYNAGILGNVSLGLWATYGIDGDYSENDFFLKYSYPSKAGDFSMMLTDFYFPSAGIKFSNYEGEGNGAHTLELSLQYEGPEEIPVRLLLSRNVHNQIDGDHTLYVEAGYSFNIQDAEMEVFAGAAQGESDWFGIETNKFEVTNVGFKASKQLKMTSEFSLPLSLSMIYNPYLKQSYVVFGLSL